MIPVGVVLESADVRWRFGSLVWRLPFYGGARGLMWGGVVPPLYILHLRAGAYSIHNRRRVCAVLCVLYTAGRKLAVAHRRVVRVSAQCAACAAARAYAVFFIVLFIIFFLFFLPPSPSFFVFVSPQRNKELR